MRTYNGTPGQPDTIIVDIDGTIADRGDRDPYAKTGHLKDTPHQDILDLVGMLAVTHTVVFMTGRVEATRQDTSDWLNHHTVPGILLMREDGDYRADDVVKYDLFDNHVRDFNNVKMVIDDRNQVVKMWRALGIRCLQVADGDF